MLTTETTAEVLSYLALRNLVDVRLVNSTFNALIPPVLNARLLDMLARYFPQRKHAHGLRDLMRITGSIVGGSEALVYVHPDSSRAPGGLDIYTRHGYAEVSTCRVPPGVLRAQ